MHMITMFILNFTHLFIFSSHRLIVLFYSQDTLFQMVYTNFFIFCCIHHLDFVTFIYHNTHSLSIPVRSSTLQSPSSSSTSTDFILYYLQHHRLGHPSATILQNVLKHYNISLVNEKPVDFYQHVVWKNLINLTFNLNYSRSSFPTNFL